MWNEAWKRLLGICLYVLATVSGSCLAHHQVAFVAPASAPGTMPAEAKQRAQAVETSSGALNAVEQWGPLLIALSIRAAIGTWGRNRRPD
jgi:hypothetical protein